MSVKKNVLANYLGQGWSAFVGIIFVPVYIGYLGIEAYGLIGLFVTLQAWFALLDMGMAPAISREMARFVGGGRNSLSICDLFRSVEIIIFLIACLIAVAVYGASEWLASDWVNSESISTESVSVAFQIMGLAAALRFMGNIYTSSLIGLEKQIDLNIVNSVMATVRALGAIVVLEYLSSDIITFFYWQGFVSIMTTLLLGCTAYSALPSIGRHANFSIAEIKGIGKFAAGMLGTTALALMLTQIDKLLLSNLLSLADFGFYMLAVAASGVLFMLVAPVTQAWYPRLCALVSQDDEKKLIEVFHTGSQLVTVVMGSAAIILVVFSDVILSTWTQNDELSNKTAMVLSMLAVGNLLNGLMRMPYQLQLAFGWTGLGIKMNIVAVLLLVPLIFVAVPAYGIHGAAGVWILLNVIYVTVGIQFMYKRLIPNEKMSWYWNDILLPLSLGLTLAFMIKNFVVFGQGIMIDLLLLVIISLAVLLSVAFGAANVRREILRWGGRQLVD